MADLVWAYRDRDCSHFFCRGILSSSPVSARLSFGRDDAFMGSIPSRMGIPHGIDPTGRWSRLGLEQEISDRRNLDWRAYDGPHPIPISADLDPRPRRNDPGDHGSDQLRLRHIDLRWSSARPGVGIAARSRAGGETATA